MVLEICNQCPHGVVKDGRSLCNREAVYSYLTRCIRKVALEDYLERVVVKETDCQRVA